MTEVNYQVSANLMLLGHQDETGFARGEVSWQTTLLDAIRRAKKMVPDERARVSIVVGEAGTEKTLLRWNDIEPLSQRPDFPRD